MISLAGISDSMAITEQGSEQLTESVSLRKCVSDITDIKTDSLCDFLALFLTLTESVSKGVFG